MMGENLPLSYSAHELLLPPSVEMVTLDDVRTALRLQALGDSIDAAEDVLLKGYQLSARRYAETVKGLAYVGQVWQQEEDNFCSPLRLYPCPVQQINSISYLDCAGTSQTLDASTYRLDANHKPALVVPTVGNCWPATLGGPGSVTIEFIAGHLMPVSVNVGDSTLTVGCGRIYAENDRLTFSNLGGDLPAGIAANTLHYVIGPSDSTFQISTSLGGSAVNIVDAGTGQTFAGSVPEEERTLIFLLTHHFYENRLSVIQGAAVQLPYGIQALLWNNRVAA